MPTITPETRVAVHVCDLKSVEPKPMWVGRFDEFCWENPGLVDSGLMGVLSRGGRYDVGGGAAGLFQVRLAEEGFQ